MPRPRRSYPAGVRGALPILLVACSLALGACGDTLQDQPISHNTLEDLVINSFPVYWLGGTFHGLQITEASHDPSGGFSVQYGDCVEGGQGTCVPPVRVVTSADNGFLPGGFAPGRPARIRGVPALLVQGGRTVVIPTASVVVDIYATDAALAHAASLAVVPINEPGTPGGPLPARLPDTGFGSTPLSSQEPSPLHPVR